MNFGTAQISFGRNIKRQFRGSRVSRWIRNNRTRKSKSFELTNLLNHKNNRWQRTENGWRFYNRLGSQYILTANVVNILPKREKFVIKPIENDSGFKIFDVSSLKLDIVEEGLRTNSRECFLVITGFNFSGEKGEIPFFYNFITVEAVLLERVGVS